jgi:hypothetical protein
MAIQPAFRLEFSRDELDEAIALRPDLFESAIQRIHEMAAAISM